MVTENNMVHMASPPQASEVWCKPTNGAECDSEVPDPNERNVIELLFCDFLWTALVEWGGKQKKISAGDRLP